MNDLTREPSVFEGGETRWMQEPRTTYTLFSERINRYPLLTPEEEHELAVRCSKGDEEAIELMECSNLRLVISVARKFSNISSHFDLLDLVHYGYFGLRRAVRGFDPYRQGEDDAYGKFSTYATWWIKQSITRALSDFAHTIRVPVYRTEEQRRIRGFVRKYQEQHSGFPSVAEIVAETGLSEQAVSVALESMFSMLQFDHNESGEEGDLWETLAADEKIDVTEVVFQRELVDKVQSVLGYLTARERDIIMRRFGLGDHKPQTLEEVGQEYGITRERVRQIEKKAVNRLRKDPEMRALSAEVVGETYADNGQKKQRKRYGAVSSKRSTQAGERTDDGRKERPKPPVAPIDIEKQDPQKAFDQLAMSLFGVTVTYRLIEPTNGTAKYASAVYLGKLRYAVGHGDSPEAADRDAAKKALEAYRR